MLRHKSVEIQTMVDLKCSQQLRILELEKENQELKTKLKRSTQKIKDRKEIVKNLRKIFSYGQIRKLKNPHNRAVWSQKDISSAITLYSSGARSYRYLYRRGYPLPALSTLKRWAGRIKLQRGILSPVLDVMKGLDMDKKERLCILSFDEMKVKESYEYDQINDTTLKPSKYVQVALIRGLLKNWKQPIFYQYDTAMTKAILYDIINQLDNINFTVVAATSDLGPSNSSLRRDLEISEKKPFFSPE